MLPLSDNQFLLVKNAAHTLNFKNWDVKPTDINVTGGGYTSSLKCITIIDTEGKLDDYYLFMKVCEEDEEVEKQFPISAFYSRERYVYSELFPELTLFEEQYNIKEPFSSVGKFFGVVKDGKTCSFLFENLAARNYRVSDRKDRMDARNIELVLREYAKFHALGFAMKELQPEKYKGIASKLNGIGEDYFSKTLISIGIKRVRDLLDDHPAATAIKEVENVANKFFYEDLKNTEDHLVFLHGDSWGNNFMFQYQDENDPGNPTSVRILDWQMSRMGSPVLDITCHLCLCAPKSVLQNIEKYLALYYDTLSNNLRGFGCDPEKIFPFSLLMKHWRKYSKFGTIFSAAFLPMVVGEVKDVGNINISANNGIYVMDYFAGCLLDNKKLGSVCTERILDSFLNFHEQGFL